MFIDAIVVELFTKMSKAGILYLEFTVPQDVFASNSASSDYKMMD
jgi:hypothetical protein